MGGAVVADLLSAHRARAAELLPPEVVDYLEAGAGEETSVREAVAAWREVRLLPRVLRDVTRVDTATALLGTPLAAPLAVAPTAFHRLAHPEAEAATLRGAAAAGALTVVSTRASTRLEELGALAQPWWFQVYAMRDRQVTDALVRRAADAGARALVLTGDTPYVGLKPRLRGLRPDLPPEHLLVNLAEHLAPGLAAGAAAEAVEQDPSAGPAAIGRLKRCSGLPVLVKGVLRPDDAVRCLDAGADGLVVSNHGGRQLDRAVATARALGPVVRAVAGRAPVLVDGGVRSGLDVLVALALGARAVLVGRPVLWALAAGGADAVSEVLGGLRGELAHAMALAGAASLDEVGPDLVAGSA